MNEIRERAYENYGNIMQLIQVARSFRLIDYSKNDSRFCGKCYKVLQNLQDRTGQSIFFK